MVTKNMQKSHSTKHWRFNRLDELRFRGFDAKPGALEATAATRDQCSRRPGELEHGHPQGGAPKIAKLVYNSNNYGL